MCVVRALWRLRQGDHEFEASLGYIVRNYFQNIQTTNFHNNTCGQQHHHQKRNCVIRNQMKLSWLIKAPPFWLLREGTPAVCGWSAQVGDFFCLDEQKIGNWMPFHTCIDRMVKRVVTKHEVTEWWDCRHPWLCSHSSSVCRQGHCQKQVAASVSTASEIKQTPPPPQTQTHQAVNFLNRGSFLEKVASVPTFPF